MKAEILRLELRARKVAFGKSKVAELRSLFEKHRHEDPDYSLLTAKQRSKLGPQYGITATEARSTKKLEKAEDKMDVINEDDPATKSAIVLRQGALVKGKEGRALKKKGRAAVKTLVKEGSEVLGFAEKLEKADKAANAKETKKADKAAEEMAKVMKRLEKFREDHHWADYEASGAGEKVSVRMEQLYRQVVFDDKDCTMRGAMSSQPVMLSLCHPIGGRDGCEKRVCFDARALLEARPKGKKTRMANPLIESGEDAMMMKREVDEGFWEMLELAIDISEAGVWNGLTNSDPVDRVFVEASVNNGVRRFLKKNPALLTFGNIWSSVKSSKVMQYLYPKDSNKKDATESYFDLMKLPFFGLVLPMLTDLTMLLACMYMSPVDVGTSMKELVSKWAETFHRGNPVVILIKRMVDIWSDCIGKVGNVVQGEIGGLLGALGSCGWTVKESMTGPVTTLVYGVSGIMTEILGDWTGWFTDAYKKLDLPEPINPFRYVAWSMGIDDTGREGYERRKVLKEYLSGIQTSHNLTSLMALMAMALVPTRIWAQMYKYGFYSLGYILAGSEMVVGGATAAWKAGSLGISDFGEGVKQSMFEERRGNQGDSLTAIMSSALATVASSKLLTSPSMKASALMFTLGDMVVILEQKYRKQFSTGLGLASVVLKYLWRFMKEYKPLMGIMLTAYNVYNQVFRCRVNQMLGLCPTKGGKLECPNDCCFKRFFEDYANTRRSWIHTKGRQVGSVLGSGLLGYGLSMGAAALGAGTAAAGTVALAPLAFVGGLAYQFSDERMKKRVSKSAVASVGPYKIHLYRMTHGPNKGAYFFGMSAQQVSKIKPSAVFEMKRGPYKGKLGVRYNELPKRVRAKVAYLNSIDLSFGRAMSHRLKIQG